MDTSHSSRFTGIPPVIEKLICLGLVLVSCLLLEAASRLFFKAPDDLSSILSILEQDSVLFWRQRPNLDIIFQGVQVNTNQMGFRNREFDQEKNGKFRIVCLGASPTFGWGVKAEESYPAVLERAIKERCGSAKNIEVINAGIIGYSSYQGLLLFKKQILGLSPDVVIVSYLVNDLDKYRFYRNSGQSDNELRPKNEALVFAENMLNQSAFCQAFRRLLFKVGRINTKLYGKAGYIYQDNRRVALPDYRNNLNEIIAIAKKNGIKVVLVNMPVRHAGDGGGAPGSRREKEKYYADRAQEHAKALKYEDAIAELEKAVAVAPDSPRSYYYLGLYSRERKDFEKADAFFKKAKEKELFECARISNDYNQVMKEVAGQEKVPIVDIVSAFKNVSFAGDDKALFVNPEHDFVHPNFKGNSIIGKEICTTLVEYNLLP